MDAHQQSDTMPVQLSPDAPAAARASRDGQEGELATLRQQLALLQQQVANQQAQIATLVHQLNQPVAAPVEIIEASEAINATVDMFRESAAPTGGAITSRRALLK